MLLCRLAARRPSAVTVHRMYEMLAHLSDNQWPSGWKWYLLYILHVQPHLGINFILCVNWYQHILSYIQHTLFFVARLAPLRTTDVLTHFYINPAYFATSVHTLYQLICGHSALSKSATFPITCPFYSTILIFIWCTSAHLCTHWTLFTLFWYQIAHNFKSSLFSLKLLLRTKQL